MRPILKWPGGKFRLVPAIAAALPEGARLVEPFAGSGAVFLNTHYAHCLIADANPDCIQFHQALATNGSAFITRCRALFSPESNSRDEYLRRRDQFNQLPQNNPERAALFLYLNRHGYNGLIRYNASGSFNVPFGRYSKPYFPETEMLAFLDKLQTATVIFSTADFRDTFRQVKKHDIVYCDPPYIPLSATANFTTYAGAVFKQADQEALAICAEKAAQKGATVVISNHDSKEARHLYRNADEIRPLTVRRSISCHGGKRNAVGEILALYSPR